MPTATKNTAKPAPKAEKADKEVATRVGLVESDKRDKTRTVVVPNVSTHPKYGKTMRRRTVLHVHDQGNLSHTGDMVEVAPCRPMSKTKFWKLVRIVQKGASMKFEGVATPGAGGENKKN